MLEQPTDGRALSPEQAFYFETHGYLVVENALTPDELRRLRAAADEAEAIWRADVERPGYRRHDLEQVLGIMEYDPIFLDTLVHPRIFPMVRQLLGADVMMLDHDYFITPLGAEIPWGWHVDLDLPNIFHSRSRLMVKVFYVLEDVPPDGGGTLVLPGSHRFSPDLELPNVEVPEDLPGAVQMALPAGSAYIFTGRTYHSAGNNHSDVVRRLLIYNYGHKWMRIWQSYEPSEQLMTRADTPMLRQLLGMTDPYGLENAAWPGEET